MRKKKSYPKRNSKESPRKIGRKKIEEEETEMKKERKK